MDRRTLLTTTGMGLTVGLAGCNVLGPKHQQAESAWDVDRADGTILDGEITGTATLGSGTYGTLELAPERDATYEMSFEVVEGSAIDFFVMGSGWYEDQYRDRNDDLRYIEELSSLDTKSDTVQGDVSAGEYRLVVDNTAVYGAEPAGNVEVEIRIEGSIR